ncbi:MAG: HIT family hydrolase [Peptococcaceae bacterium BICA1-7]|nr:MAG: HIT family hydrolase [Peptococcaceae bacterium BICA1-7]HBV95462.1 HIT domain-containing protein [Desulfotomaculum sp.]
MDRIWAPWRTVYIGKDHGSACIFCEKLTSDKDAENYVLFRGDRVFALLNLYPYNNGHILISPKRHVGDLTDLDQDEILELGLVTQKMTALLREAFNPEGFNIGVNLGKIAGAGVPGHFHVHIVPRWGGDTNFMPVLGDVRVISEGLDLTYKKLVEVLNKEK